MTDDLAPGAAELAEAERLAAGGEPPVRPETPLVEPDPEATEETP